MTFPQLRRDDAPHLPDSSRKSTSRFKKVGIFFFCCLLENGWPWGNPVETSCLATLTAGVVRKKVLFWAWFSQVQVAVFRESRCPFPARIEHSLNLSHNLWDFFSSSHVSTVPIRHLGKPCWNLLQGKRRYRIWKTGNEMFCPPVSVRSLIGGYPLWGPYIPGKPFPTPKRLLNRVFAPRTVRLPCRIFFWTLHGSTTVILNAKVSFSTRNITPCSSTKDERATSTCGHGIFQPWSGTRTV